MKLECPISLAEGSNSLHFWHCDDHFVIAPVVILLAETVDHLSDAIALAVSQTVLPVE